MAQMPHHRALTADSSGTHKSNVFFDTKANMYTGIAASNLEQHAYTAGAGQHVCHRRRTHVVALARFKVRDGSMQMCRGSRYYRGAEIQTQQHSPRALVAAVDAAATPPSRVDQMCAGHVVAKESSLQLQVAAEIIKGNHHAGLVRPVFDAGRHLLPSTSRPGPFHPCCLS